MFVCIGRGSFFPIQYVPNLDQLIMGPNALLIVSRILTKCATEFYFSIPTINEVSSTYCKLNC